MELSEDVVKRFCLVKKFNEDEKVRCARYSPDGELLCVSLNRRLKVYCALSGSVRNIVSVESSVLAHVTRSSILLSSDSSVRLLSLYDNKHMHTFRSHKESVESISVSRTSDLFLTSCRSEALMWSLSCRNPIRRAEVVNGLAAFIRNDNFVISMGSLLKFYDARNPVGPLWTTLLPRDRHRRISATDKLMCISGDFSHRVYDFEGRLVHTMETEGKSYVVLTPDSQYSVCSSSTYLLFTAIGKERRVHTVRERGSSFGMLEFNPCYGQFATLSRGPGLWMPLPAE